MQHEIEHKKIMHINWILENLEKNTHLKKTSINKHVSLGKHQQTKLTSGILQF